jgi:hypothetical protein
MTSTTTTPTTVPKVICAECRHENEGERIYCHNCGERLDRSVVIAKKKGQDPQDERRRLQKMMEGPSKSRQNFFAVSKLALAAAVAAALVEIAMPPEVPAPTKATPQQIDLDLENAASFQRPGPLEYSQEQVNAYLTYRLISKKKALTNPVLTFVRATVSLNEGSCTIAMERSLFGYSLFSRGSYRIDVSGGKIAATNVGGWIGRLPIHPAIMRYGDIIFADLRTALDRERKLIAKMGAITLHDGSVTITPPSR